MAGKLNADLLKNLNENFERMNKELSNVSKNVKTLSDGFKDAKADVGSFVESLRSISTQVNALKQLNIKEALGIDTATVAVSDLKKKLVELEGETSLGVRGSAIINKKSGKWKFRPTEEKIPAEEQSRLIERRNSLRELVSQLDKGKEKSIIDLVNLQAKQTKAEIAEEQAKQQALQKTIALYNQYAEKYKELGLLIKQETKSGKLTDRGKELQDEQKKYRDLAISEAQAIRKARIDGVKLSQEEELRLEVAHQQALRKTRERLDKQGAERAGTKGAQERAIQEKGTRSAVKEINKLLDERAMKESNLAKEGKTEKYYDTQRRKIEEINKKIEEQKRLLGSYGKSGERALGQLGISKDRGTIKQLIEDTKALEVERKRLVKLAEDDAKWHEQQRKNIEAIFAANGKAINQQERLAAKIDELSRKRADLLNQNLSTDAFGKQVAAYNARINNYEQRRQDLEKQFPGSATAGQKQYLESEAKAALDAAEARKKSTEEAKKQAAADREAAMQAVEAKKKIAQADKESIAVQKRQVDIKNRLRQIDNDRAARAKFNKSATKQEIAAENQEYKHLSQELTKLIARQKELDAVSKGSGRRARTQLESYEVNQADKAARRYANTLRKLDEEKNRVGESSDKLISSIKRLGSAFGIAFSVQGLVQFGRKLVETRGEFEMQFVAMKQIIGDVDAATKIWNQTMQQALQSPFRAMQLVDYTKKLAAYRIETEKLFDTTKRLADVSAGLGVDMGRLILAYGQVKTANYLRASEVRQFTEAGVNIYDNLANYFSEIEGRTVTVGEVIERVTKRMVLFSDVEEIFKRMTDEGGIFFNMQEVQADTVRGQIMKLHDAYDQMLNTIGQANQGTLRNLTETANRLVRNWRDVAAFLKAQIPIFAVMLPYWISMRKIQRMTAEESALLTSRLATLKMSLLSTTKSTKSATLALHEQRAAMMRQRREMALYIERTKRLVKNKELLTRATRMWTRSMKTSMIQSAAFDSVLKSLIVSGNLLKTTLRSIAPFLAIEGVIFLVNALTSASRKAAEFKKELREVTDEQMGRGGEEADGYKKLVKELGATNEGSIERAKVIQKINDKYGTYLDNLYDEHSSLEDVANGYELVAERAKEAARARALEEGYSKILGKYNQERNDAIFDLAKRPHGYTGGFGKAGQFLSVGGTFEISKEDAKGFSEYVDEIVEKNEKLYASMSLIERQKAIRQLYKDYFGKELPAGAASLFNFIDNTVDRLAALKDYEQSLEKDFNLRGLNKELRDRIIGIRDEAKEIITQIEESKQGGAIVLPLGMKLDIKKTRDDIDTDVNSILSYIKRRVNEQSKQKEIDLRLSAGIIGEEEAKKLRDRIGRLTDETANQINDKVIKQIKEAYNVTGDLLDYIAKNPWDKNMGEMFAAINSSLLTQNDIVQGIDKAEENISGRLQGQLKVLQDINRKKNSGLITDRAQLEALLKQERTVQTTYQWLQKTLFLLKNRAEVSEVQSALLDNTTIDKAKERVRKKFGENVANEITIGYAFDYANVNMVQSAVAEAYHKAGDEIDKEIKSIKASANADKEKIKMLERQRDIQYELANAYGYVDKKARTGGQKESVSRLISLIKEMRSEYDKLSKSAYGYAKSEEKVRASFGDSWEAILKEAGVPEDFDFSTNAGEIAALEKVRDYVKGNAKFAKDAWKDVQKIIDQLKTESEIDVQVRIREDFGRQMEEAFGNYELTLDLQKLNLSNDVLSDLFGIDAVELPDLRSMVAEFYYESAAAGADPTELVKQLEGYYKKIDDMERKQQHERIKEYAKYLEYELSERAKIEMEYTRKYAEVSANQAFTPEQKKQIQKRLGEERDKALAKQEWEDFNGSETYIQIMEDLEHQGVSALAAMRTELERIKKNAENLSPRALKEVVNAIEKIDEISIKRGMPIGNIVRAVGSLNTAKSKAIDTGLTEEQVSSRRAAQQTQADINARLLSMEHTYNVLQSQLGTEKEIERLEKERYQNSIKLNEEFGEMFMWDGADEVMQEMVDNRIENIESARSRINDLQEKRKGATEDETKEIDQQLAAERANLECLEKERGLLLEQLKLNKELLLEEQKRAATPEERKKLQERIDALEKEIKVLRGQADAVNNVTKKYGILGNSITDAFQKTAQWGQQALDVFNSMKTMMTSLGVDTDTDAWDDAATAMETLNTITSTASSMAQKIESGDWVGAVMDGVKSIMDIVSSWAGNNDASLDRQIRKQQERIEELQRAYQRLEKQIEKTWSSLSYMSTYEKRVENIKEQIEAIERQRALEEAKKNTDNSRVREYTNAIEDAYDELEELKQKKIEVFGGIGEGGYRSAAEGFVDAWKSAFLETGDGLQGLQDHFDEFLQDWFVKQATMRVAGKMLEHTFNMIDESVSKDSAGGVAVTTGELRKIRDDFAAQAPLISEALEQLAGTFDLNGEGKLSGLAAGIQGMTEEQANILEAYWNSVRMYTANIDVNVERIAAILGAGGINTNPMLDKLDSIINNTSYIKRIYDMVEPIVTNNGSGRGFRTYAI